MAAKKKRRAYLDSFQKDSSGEYVYKGDLYAFESQGKELRRELAQLWGLCIAMMAALITAGCIGAPGAGRCFYVLMPYAVNLIAGISVCWGLGRLTSGGNPLRAYVYKATVKEIPVRSILTAVCAGTAITGELVYIFRNGTEGQMAEGVLFMVLEGCILKLALLIKKQILKMNWERISHIEP